MVIILHIFSVGQTRFILGTKGLNWFCKVTDEHNKNNNDRDKKQ